MIYWVITTNGANTRYNSNDIVTSNHPLVDRIAIMRSVFQGRDYAKQKQLITPLINKISKIQQDNSIPT